jgi:hypothetical protein
MKLYKVASSMLRVTALAWAIPLAQAAEPPQSGASRSQPNNASVMRLGTHRGIESPLTKVGQKRRKALKP